ncbi:non-ribosomal peptide synthetase [Actinomadura rubrisoli]|uniref:Amino acid adenylation domain-containing protein n=1 Tax=Actinomadura rubrisoli TaxID=2530368 RepID=A0A4R5C9L9_9ACTN|nr:non-ribosomal peptide synthetase [Actinomadura rubrisoli]TDD95356.1 amino acid adenylation domain-containing protein [Actinomadura rubrisoli]
MPNEPAGRFRDPPEATVNVLVHRRGVAHPDAVAVAAADATLTYGELLRRAYSLSRRLCGLGVGPETTVGLCLPRSAALVVGALAVLDAGGAYVVIDPSHPAQRQRVMLDHSRARVVLASQRSMALAGESVEAIGIGEFTGTEEPDGFLPASPPVSVGGNNLAYVVYTSGSSGLPKGVMVEHRSLRRIVDWYTLTFDIAASDRVMQMPDPGFDASVWPCLTAGASLRIPEDGVGNDPTALRDWMLAHGITIGCLPTHLAESQMVPHWPDSGPRIVLTGGDVLHRVPPPGLPFAVVNIYGLAEATVVSASGPVKAGADDDPPAIGRPIDDVELHIVDSELHPVPDGEEGEVLLGGPLVARGYLHATAQTALRFVPDHLGGRPGARLLRTGDLARRRKGGDIEFVGRADNQVKVHGFRVEPDEVAATISRHPAVRSSVVVAAASDRGGRELVAYVAPLGTAPDPDELTAFLAEFLPAYMIPSQYVWLAGSSARETVTEPDDRTEVQLASMAAVLLRLDHVGVDDDFFRLGGHSMLAAQLVMRIDDRFGVELPLPFVFDHPTVRDMAAEVDRLVREEGMAGLAAVSTDEGDSNDRNPLIDKKSLRG